MTFLDPTLSPRSRIALRYILACNKCGEHPSLGKLAAILRVPLATNQAAREVDKLCRLGLLQKFGDKKFRPLIVTVRGQDAA